jgi:hypothetical protein
MADFQTAPKIMKLFPQCLNTCFFLFQKTVFDKLLVGRVSFYSYDSASFPPSSIQFSSLFAIDNKDVSQGSWKNPRFQIGPNDVSVDVISLMIEQCFAKKG